MFLQGVFVLSLLCLGARSDDGPPQVVASPQPIRALVGDQVVLPCCLTPPTSVATRTVEWSRLGNETQYVIIYRNRREDPDMQAAAFRGRSALFPEQLTLGNVSLRISNLSLEDSGTYRCYLPGLRGQDTVELIVSTESLSDAETTITTKTTEDEDTWEHCYASRSHIFLFLAFLLFIILLLAVVILGLKSKYCSQKEEKEKMLV